MKLSKSFSLTAKFNLLSFMLVLLTAITVSTIQLNRDRESRLKGLLNHGSEVSNVIANLSEYALFTADQESLKTILNSVKNNETTYLGLLDSNKKIVAEKWLKRVQLKFPDDKIDHGMDATQPVFSADGQFIQFIQPVISSMNTEFDTFPAVGQSALPQHELVGYVRLIFNTYQIQQQQQLAIRSTLLTTALIIAIALLLTLLLTRRITQPVAQLVRATQLIAEDNLNEKIAVTMDGELGLLASNFNNMVKQLTLSRKKLEVYQQTLEKRVEVRTEELFHALEAAEAGSRAKSEFLATMSHEIRTPMNGVLGMTELLLSSELTERQQHFAKTILRSGDSLMSIINDILDFSKIEAGKLELEQRDFNLRVLLEDTADILAERAHRKGLDLTPVLPLEPVLMVNSDENRIRQILINLIGNAIKFTETGEIIVRLINFGEADGRVQLRLEVSDTGIGMSRDQQSRIFDSFSQADSSTTREFGGTGLGLAISQQLVSLLGGNLEVESEPGKGSTFYFNISLATADQNHEVSEFTQELHGKRVLIVDDNLTNREILHNQCEAWGMIDGSADNGLKALDMLRLAERKNQQYDLILLDWHMPNMDGIELAKLIQQDPAISTPRMVMLSSAAFDEEATRASEVGIQRYLNKPVRQKPLFDCLTQVINSPVVTPSSIIKPNPESTEATLIKASILLAEDNLVNQEVAKLMLEMLGCQVTVASNGQEAIDSILQKKFDLVLMDCHMPEKDGFAAATEIRQHEKTNANSKHLPIIALTANIQKGIQDECRKAGMDDYMSKPFDQQQLSEVLNRWIAGEQSSKELKTETKKVSPDHEDDEDIESVLQRKPLDIIRSMQKPGVPSLLGRVIKIYLGESPDLMRSIHQAVSEGDSSALSEAAHSLKSSSANLGAMQMANISKELEALGRDEKVKDASILLDQLDREFESACSALNRELEIEALVG